MTDMPAEATMEAMQAHGHSPGVVLRSVVIGLTAFLTVVDLFATQAILPSLARHYGVTPGAMGFAVNASTIGMAVAGLVVGSFSPYIDRRMGILASLLLLAIPTSLLAIAPNLAVFTILRILQGLCMASAFTLTLAYLGEQCSAMDAGGAFAAYITGNVGSNLIGRLISATVADNLGLATNFYFFALLNVAGALLVYFTIKRVQPMHSTGPTQSPLSAMIEHWHDPALRAAFGVGFCILFAFIGTFTYVNFVLVRAPLSLGMMGVGLVYFVFLPSIVTTLLAGKVVDMLGMRLSLWGGLAIAALGLPLMRSPGWCWSGSAPSLRKPAPPALSGEWREQTAGLQAAPTLLVISLVAWSAALCLANCSTISDGWLALRASALLWLSRRPLL
jgi:MFS transporter, YNFM family, putative membrane transport protein